MARKVTKGEKAGTKRSRNIAAKRPAATKGSTTNGNRKSKPSKSLKKAISNSETKKKPASASTKGVAEKSRKAAKKVAGSKAPKNSPIKRTSSKRGAVVRKKAVTKTVAARNSSKPDVDQVIKDFRRVVNLKRDQLERWLSLPDSKKLGFKDEIKEGTVGHESGKRILKILSKRRDKYTDDDLRHMQTVVGFVRKHKKEKPPGDVFASNWRYSLMNWGHDPMK